MADRVSEERSGRRLGPSSGTTFGSRMVAAYDPRFRGDMTVAQDDVDDGVAIAATFEGLDPFARDLVDLLLVGVGAGEAVPERLRELIDEDGEPLWRNGVLLPRLAPTPGATIDPRYYSASCRLNPALTAVQPLAHLGRNHQGKPHRSGSDVLWDAVVVAARLETTPLRLARNGEIRKDDRAFLFRRLPGEDARWDLALRFARATGLVRSAARRLYGVPESKPRPLTNPALLLDEGGPRRAGELLLRVVRHEWVALSELEGELRDRLPQVLTEGDASGWAQREGVWLRQAGELLTRSGVFDASELDEGDVAWRIRGERRPRPPGFLLTPGRDILVEPGELPSWEYGRLCRVAPYVDGDVVHRHTLTREGVAAELACGTTDVLDWFGLRSRTGVPGNVRTSVEAWMREASRVSLVTGVSLVEHPDGRFEVLGRDAPSEARTIDYHGLPPARFEVEEGEILVPFGEDALTVRALVGRIGRPLSATEIAHRWEISPSGVGEPDQLLDELRRYHDGELPGELEAAVHAACGRVRCWVEEAVVLHLPDEATDAIRRDRVAGPLVARELVRGQCVVDRRDLPLLRRRLDELGYQLEGGEA